jgi:hypothetical protein
MKLKPGAIDWLRDRFIIHQGNNGRNGAVFLVDDVLQQVRGQGKTTLIRVIPLEDYWPDNSGKLPETIRYSIANLPPELLQMSSNEQCFHTPIFALFDPETSETYTAPEEFDQETNQKGKKTMSMNLKAAAAIVLEDVTTIKVAMGTDTNPQTYTYLIPREVVKHLTEADIEKGVWVVREGTKKNSLAIAQVISVDETPDIDLNRDTEWKWAFQLIDTSLRDKMVERTERLYKQLQEKQRERSQQGILAALGITKDDLLAIESK